MRYDGMRYDGIRWDAMGHDVMGWECDEMGRGGVRCDEVRCDGIKYDGIRWHVREREWTGCDAMGHGCDVM